MTTREWRGEEGEEIREGVHCSSGPPEAEKKGQYITCLQCVLHLLIPPHEIETSLYPNGIIRQGVEGLNLLRATNISRRNRVDFLPRWATNLFLLLLPRFFQGPLKQLRKSFSIIFLSPCRTEVGAGNEWSQVGGEKKIKHRGLEKGGRGKKKKKWRAS